MSNKSRLNWSSDVTLFLIQEDKLLKYLRDEEKIEKWNEIANRLKIISSHPRTSKQCRERYISTAKFCENQDQIKNWTQSQQGLIFKLYLEHGPKWTFFTQFFESRFLLSLLRSQNSIKNRFYNFIRKILRKMNQLNENRYPYNKKSLKIESLLVILELSKKIETESQYLIGQKPNPQMELLLIRNEILKFSLTLEQTSPSQVLDLVDRIHKTNCYLRHLGIFKAKNKKTWKLDRKRLLYILGMQGCPQVYKEHKFDEDVFTTKNLHSPVSSPVLSQQCSEKNISGNVFEELDLDASYQFHNWTDDFNKKMFEILGEDILPSFNFDCFI